MRKNWEKRTILNYINWFLVGRLRIIFLREHVFVCGHSRNIIKKKGFIDSLRCLTVHRTETNTLYIMTRDWISEGIRNCLAVEPISMRKCQKRLYESRIKIIIILNEANRREWRKSIPRNAREIEPFTPTFPHHKPEHKTEFSSRKHNKSTRQSSKINTQLTTMPLHSVTRPMHVIYFRHSSPVEKKEKDKY